VQFKTAFVSGDTVSRYEELKELKSTAPGLRLFHGSITRFEKKYFLAFVELKGTYSVYGWPRVVLTEL